MADKELSLIIKARDQASRTIDSTLGNWKSAVIGVGAAYLGWSAVTGAIGSVITAGMEAEKVWTQVRASLDRHGYAVNKNVESIQKLGIEMMKTTGISDEEYGKSVQTLIDHNVKLADTHRVIQAATDLSVAKDMSLTTAVELLGKANEGVTATLTRYGIVIGDNVQKGKELDAVLQLLNERFGGAAQANMDTMAGKWLLAGAQWDEMKEALAKLTSPALIGGLDVINSALSTMMTWFDGLASNFNNNKLADSLNKILDEIAERRQGIAETVAELNKTYAVDSLAQLTATANQVNAESGLLELKKEVTAWAKADLYIIKEATLATTQRWAVEAAATAGHLKGLQTIANIEKMAIKAAAIEAEKGKKAAEQWLAQMMVIGEATAQGLYGAFDVGLDAVAVLFDDLAEKSKNVFIKMAAHFGKYFVNSLLEQLATKVIGTLGGGGILGLLGGLFDNPTNDAMAMKQGADFSKYFGKGAKDKMTELGLAWDVANKFAIASKGTPRYALSDPWNYESKLAARQQYLDQSYNALYGDRDSRARALAHRLNQQLNININGNLVDENFVQRVLIRKIEKYSRSGATMVPTRTPTTFNMGYSYGK